MAILAECPVCHKKRSVKNRLCSCGEDLVKAKRSKEKVRYWIDYRMPGGKQKREPVGFSIEEARDADGKRRTQKRENTIFDIKPDASMTFKELTEWYLDLASVKSLTYYPTLIIHFKNLNRILGNMIVKEIKPSVLSEYQSKRQGEGKSDQYIDHEITTAKTMINRAFDDDKVCGDTVKRFKKVKRLMKDKNANARKIILAPDQYARLAACMPTHTQQMTIMGYNTGMRNREIRSLVWDQVDLKNRIISLKKEDTKTKRAREIPISGELYEVLKNIPRAIHDNHVFLYKGKPIKSIRRSFKAACKKAGITYGRFEEGGLIFHDLRHTFVTYARKGGVHESVINGITGHSTHEMFDRYNTVDMDDKRAAIDQFSRSVQNVDQTVDQVEEKG